MIQTLKQTDGRVDRVLAQVRRLRVKGRALRPRVLYLRQKRSEGVLVEMMRRLKRELVVRPGDLGPVQKVGDGSAEVPAWASVRKPSQELLADFDGAAVDPGPVAELMGAHWA